MKEYYVYILKCNDGSYYTGSTSDIEERLNEHNDAAVKSYTSIRLPVKLIFTQSFPDPYSMVSAERQIKGWSRAKKEALIAGNFDLLIELSKNSKRKAEEAAAAIHPSTGSG